MNGKISKHELDGLILMGPFGSGKTYLGKSLNELGLAHYDDLEPVIYDRFANGTDFDGERATKFLRAYYEKQLSSPQLVVFESTGVVQRPLLLDMMAKYNIALLRVVTPKAICLERIAQRNLTSKRPVDMDKAVEFFDYWNNEIAPTYQFDLEIDGVDAETAVQKIQTLLIKTYHTT